MGFGINKLTALAIKKAKTDLEKVVKLTDGGGLVLCLHPNGSKYWLFNYTRPTNKKRNTISFGDYPQISLDEARNKRDDARKQVKEGIDPAQIRTDKKVAHQKAIESSFKVVAKEVMAMRELEEKIDDENIRRLNVDVYPYIGDEPISSLDTDTLYLKVFKRIVERGSLESARRVRGMLSIIFQYARKRKLIIVNPIEDIDLPKPKGGNFAAVTETSDLEPMVKKIWAYGESNPRSTPSTRAALKLSVLIFQRPGEIRHLEKSAYYPDEQVLKYTTSKTKQAHIVPLSHQAVEIIENVIKVYPHSKYIFVGRSGGDTCISDGTVNSAIKRLGYGGKQTAHGLRATARTMLDEVLEKRVDIIEHQLAHKVKDSNGTAYNRTKHLNKRREMMQEWADYVDSLVNSLNQC